MGHDINPLPGARGAIRTGILIGLLGNVSVPFETEGEGKILLSVHVHLDTWQMLEN